MALGFRIADAFVELHLDRDELNRAARQIPGELGPQMDRAGRESGKRLGDKMGDGLAAAVEQWSAKLAKARRAEVEAANAVTLAETRLKEAREKGLTEGSARALALTQSLEKAQYRLAEAQKATITSTKSLGDAQRKLATQAGPDAERAGNDIGGKLTQGIHLAVIRNSPLIVAAIGGALAAGAPVAIAGATALFAGIGIVAAAQSKVVQTAWANTWSAISRGAQQDAAVLVPVLTKAADTIGASFQRMRPLLQDAFAASAPLIDTFVTSVTRAAENALPGMVRAVQSAGPVFEGLGSLMESIGTGLSDFFDKLSEHAPAAGQAFAALGDIMGELLPILGELLGQGVELAAMVLPPLASILGVIASALDQVGGILPAVVVGFTGLKIAGSVGPMLASLAQNLALASYNGGALAGTAGRASTVVGSLAGTVSRAGAAVPLLGIALAAVAANFAHADEQARSAARGLLEGGRAAQEAQQTIGASIAGMDASWVDGADSIVQYGDRFGWLGGAVKFGWDLVTTTTDEAADNTKASLQRMIDAMNPLQRAQAEVTYWTNELAAAQGDASYVIKDLEGNTVTAAEAQYMLGAASGEAARLQNELEQATSGMSRTLEQAAEAADQLSSALDALNGGQLDLNEAQRAFQQAIDDANDALVENGHNLDTNTQAGRDNAEALDAIAAAGNAQAEALYKQTGNYDQFSNKLIEGRDALYDAARAFGMSDEAARAYVDSVMAIPPVTSMEIETNTQTVQAELTTLQGQLSGLQPGQAVVTWASPEVVQILSDLGYDIVGLPDGEVRITATDETQPITADVISRLGAITGPTIAQITADPSSFTGISTSVLEVLGIIDGTTPNPTITADPAPAIAASDQVLGAMGIVDAQRPTPVASMNNSPLLSSYSNAMNAIVDVNAQRPTPVASMNAAPLFGTQGQALRAVWDLGGQVAHPAAYLYDGVSAGARAAAAAIWAIPAYRSVTVAIQTVQSVVAGWAAAGGPVDAYMAAAQRRDGGGPVFGPGGPTDDLVPAILGQTPFRLSNREWVIKASSSDKYGAAKMAAVNAGVAEITVPSRNRRADGGSVDAASLSNSRAMTVGDVHVHIDGTGWDLTRGSRQDARRFAMQIRDEIVDLERSFK